MANARPFRALRKLSDEERVRSLGRMEAGIHRKDVANQFNVHRSTIIRLRDRHRATGTVSDRPRSGRPKVTTQHEDRYIAVTVARRRFVDGPSLERMLRQQRGPGARRISVQTVRNRVRASGFSSRKPAKKPQLSQRHRALRRQFCARHRRWNRQQWSRVLFSDESRFCLRKVDGRIRVWRRNGERHLEPTVQPTTAYNGGSVMIWAGISLNGRTALVVVPGNLNGRRYIDEILRPHVVPYLRHMGQNAIFQDDNARPHRARIVDNFLQPNGVQRLEWPPMYPDLSCIEHLWDILGRAVNKHINQHTRLADLQRLLLQECAAIPQRQIQRLVNSMSWRLNECRVNIGGYTHY